MNDGRITVSGAGARVDIVVDNVSPALARRIALAAQGFGRPRPAVVGTRQLNGLIDRINLLQIDSVNVFERSHYLPAFARLGSYDKTLLDNLTFKAGAPHTEYWAHEAAFMRREDWPLFQWRMDAQRERYTQPDGWFQNNLTTVDWLRAELAANGPLTAGEIEHDANTRNGPWWGWSDVKRALEIMFIFGEVAVAGRTRFQRRYALTADVLPASILDTRIETPDAVRELIRRSAVAHGIGTVGDLADYYRIRRAPALAAIQELEDAGELLPVSVPGWEQGGKPAKAWLHKDARLPRRIDATALLSPFDPVVWYRDTGAQDVRLPLPHRDLHSAREAHLRVLHAAPPDRRPRRGARGPQERPSGGHPARAIGVERARRTGGDRRAPGAAPRGDGGLAGTRRHRRRRPWRPRAGARPRCGQRGRCGLTLRPPVASGGRGTIRGMTDETGIPDNHYLAALVNPDGTVYAEIVTSLVDGRPADPIRDVTTVGGQTVESVWRPDPDAPDDGADYRVIYKYVGTGELDSESGAESAS